MNTITHYVAAVVLLGLGVAAPASAQSPAVNRAPMLDAAVKSASSKLFLGVDLEGTGIVTTVTSAVSTTESGGGLGVVVGYGFSPTWALYGNLSGANIAATNSTYGLGHFDVGARVHFRSGPHVVVPFVQFGLSSRAEVETVTDRAGSHNLVASGTGVAFGGGINAHFTPALAFSGGVTWSVGSFSNYTADNTTLALPSVSATSARVHIGLIWFPQTHVSKL